MAAAVQRNAETARVLLSLPSWERVGVRGDFDLDLAFDLDLPPLQRRPNGQKKLARKARNQTFSTRGNEKHENPKSFATNLMLYAESLAVADAFIDKTLGLAIIQHLSEMAKALNLACKGVVSDSAA